MLWFKCAAVLDPIRPVLKKPGIIGWEAKQRQIDLVIERPFKGEELLRRMKGWVTVDVNQAIDIIRQYGTMKIMDDYDLVVETRDAQGLEALSNKLMEVFGEEAWVEPIPKKLLA